MIELETHYWEDPAKGRLVGQRPHSWWTNIRQEARAIGPGLDRLRVKDIRKLIEEWGGKWSVSGKIRFEDDKMATLFLLRWS